jgi:hypothetical protein
LALWVYDPIETFGSGPRFVSHWWGEPVVQFIACVAKHLHHRQLAETVPYWVCAYANYQPLGPQQKLQGKQLTIQLITKISHLIIFLYN